MLLSLTRKTTAKIVISSILSRSTRKNKKENVCWKGGSKYRSVTLTQRGLCKTGRVSKQKEVTETMMQAMEIAAKILAGIELSGSSHNNHSCVGQTNRIFNIRLIN